MTPLPQPQTPLLRAAAIALGLLAGLVAAEVGQRILFGWPKYSDYLRFDPEFGTRMPRKVELTARDDRGKFLDRSNYEGFRSRELRPAPAVAGVTPRLLVVGDSFVRAWSIRTEERFAEQAIRNSGLDLELDQLCCDDWGNFQEWLALRRFGRSLRPDFVVLALYPENDIFNDSLGFAGSTSISACDAIRPYWDGTLDDSGAPGVTHVWPLRSWWRGESALFARVERALVGLKRWSYFEDFAAQDRDRPIDLRYEFLVPSIDPQRWEPAWQNLQSLVLNFARTARALGARPAVLVIPALRQVQHCAIEEERILDRGLQSLFGTDVDAHPKEDFDYPELRLSKILAEAGVDCLLPLAALREACAKAPGGVYLRDGHLSWEGHLAVGRVLGAWLAEVARPGARSNNRLSFGRLDGEPFDLLGRGSQAPTQLDFSSGLHLPYIAYGINWRREPGWLGGEQRLAELEGRVVRVVLRSDAGPLIVSGRTGWTGRTPRLRGYPVVVEAFVYGVPLGKQILAAPGPFELSFLNAGAKLLPKVEPSQWPYVPIAVRWTPPAGQGLPEVGLARIGFLPLLNQTTPGAAAPGDPGGQLDK